MGLQLEFAFFSFARHSNHSFHKKFRGFERSPAEIEHLSGRTNLIRFGLSFELLVLFLLF